MTDYTELPMQTMTYNQFKITGHSLGINIDHAILSKKKADKKLPKKYCRNHFQADEGHDDWNDLLLLEKSGYILKRIVFGQTVFHVTEEGQKVFESKFNTEVSPKPTT